MMKTILGGLLATASLLVPAAVAAQEGSPEAIAEQLATARAEIAAQRRQLEQQDERLRLLEERLAALPVPEEDFAIAPRKDEEPLSIQDTAGNDQVERVGQAPALEFQMPQVAVLGEQGSVISRAGRLTLEPQFEYARADRNRALFRGIELVESVLIGVFDINESRQDVFTTAIAGRYGLAGNLEVGGRIPFIHRSDTSILAPIAGTSGDPAATIDTSADGSGIGDIEFLARYQLTPARAGRPFLIGNLTLVAPTGSSPFALPRDDLGRALEAPTGAGFWSVTPSVTAILPTDPAVLFGTLGYTVIFAENVNTVIPPTVIERVDPGDAIALSLGIGVALNQNTSFNLGYAHSYAMGTEIRTRAIDPGPMDTGPITTRSRDLQLGRLLFGVNYRITNKTSINWAVEIGATDDATDLRTILRIPIVF